TEGGHGDKKNGQIEKSRMGIMRSVFFRYEFPKN
ncbi:hypothetical protein HKBW3S25_01715, partial [Candidatus Hakubella thermalkaliphila]